MKSLMDAAKANNSDLNQFGWYALFPPGQVDKESVEAVERANTLTQNSNFNIMHTLVCLCAAQGNTKGARELLLKAMDAGNLEEPDSSVWLALGLIAEQYGELDAARQFTAAWKKARSKVPDHHMFWRSSILRRCPIPETA